MLIHAHISLLFLKGILFLIKNKFVAVFPFIVLVLSEALLFPKPSDIRTFPILLLYIFCVFRFKIPANGTFLLCLGLFILIYIQYVLSPPIVFATQYPLAPTGEKIAVWFYLFLIIGVLQKFRE